MSILFIAFIFLLLSALFSGSEIAFISANKLKVELKTSEVNRKSKIFRSFFDRPQDFIASMLVGNNIALVVFTYLLTKLLTPVFSQWIQQDLLVLFAVTICITIIVLIFGEYLPKIFFRIFGVDLLYGLTYPLYIIRKIITFPSWITIQFSDWLLRRFNKGHEEITENFLTRAELEQFIRTSSYEEDDSVDTEMLQRALNMKETRVRDCMVPRPEIISLDIEESISDLKMLFAESRLSKIIIYREDIDHVVGYVHHQQMLHEPESIKSCLLKISLVPEVTPVKTLMKLFIKNGTSIACVVDEFGGTSGIITLEDILEELFGEIDDEYDDDSELEKELAPGSYLFAGRLEVDYLNSKYDEIDIPEGDYNTLSGYVVNQLQEIPEEGQILETEDYTYVIYSVSEKKIESVKMIKKVEGTN